MLHEKESSTETRPKRHLIKLDRNFFVVVVVGLYNRVTVKMAGTAARVRENLNFQRGWHFAMAGKSSAAAKPTEGGKVVMFFLNR